MELQTLLTEGLLGCPHDYFSTFAPVWPQAAADLGIATAAYVAAVALMLAPRLRKTGLPNSEVGLWVLGLGAIGTVHLIEALSLRGAIGQLSPLVDGAAALLMLVAAVSLVYRLPTLAIASATLPNSVAEPEPSPQPTSQQAMLACNQQSETVRSHQESLLKQEKNIRVELETALANLQDTAERLNIALSAAHMGSWEWHLDTQQQDWSPQAKEIIGLKQHQAAVTYDDWAQQVHPEDLPRVEAAITEARENHGIFAAEYRVRLPETGELRWVLSQGRFVFSLQGEPRRMIGVIQDTTQTKQASLALKASEARFRAVFEQAAVGVTRLSAAGDWLQVNATFCELLGYEADDIIGRHFQDFTHPDDRAQDEQFYQQLVQGEVESCRFEKRYLHRDGTPIWVMVTVSTERDPEDNLVALIAVIEDIRQLKQTRMEVEQRAVELERVNGLLAMTNAMLEKRNAELDQFAYVASHDLKAPLRAIANLSEWIEEDLGGQLPAENQHQLTLLRNRVHRMEALINGLLEYSRVGRRERQIETVDAHQVVEEAIDFLAPPESFTFLLPDTMPTLQTNRTALNQVFTNLVSNAIKHHDRDDGQIQITAEDQGDQIEFAVIDDGPGIAPEYHNKVFTIFQTLKSRDELESTGIGLSLVKKIIESEGGSIHLESEVGQGTTFRFTWPKQ